jgi:hypothetical protein
LAAGVDLSQVALSRRDYETKTNAYRDNEEHLFARAWETHRPVHLDEVDVPKANGRVYKRYLPKGLD